MHTESDFSSLQDGYLKNVGKLYMQHGCSPKLFKDEQGQNHLQIVCFPQWKLPPRLSALRIISSYWRYAPAMAEWGDFLVRVYRKAEYGEAYLKASYFLKNGALMAIEEEEEWAGQAFTLSLSYNRDVRHKPDLDFAAFQWHYVNRSHLLLSDYYSAEPYLLEANHGGLITQLVFPQDQRCVVLALDLNGKIEAIYHHNFLGVGTFSCSSQMKRFFVIPEDQPFSFKGLDSWIINYKETH